MNEEITLQQSSCSSFPVHHEIWGASKHVTFQQDLMNLFSPFSALVLFVTSILLTLR